MSAVWLRLVCLSYRGPRYSRNACDEENESRPCFSFSRGSFKVLRHGNYFLQLKILARPEPKRCQLQEKKHKCHSVLDSFKNQKFYSHCCGAGAGRSRGFFWAGAGADLKFELEPEPEPIFLGRLRQIFGISEKQNDLRMFIFHCIHYTVHNFVL